jgi:hypothetical protein
MFLLGAFLTGSAVGYAADRAVTHAKPTVRQMDDRAMRDELAKELTLSTDQRRVIDSVLDWRRARDREIMQRIQPSRDSLRDSARVVIRARLDSSQLTKFAALLERNKRRADSVTRAREAGR